MSQSEIINYSWGDYDFSGGNVEVLDTSLRDGAQDSQLDHPTLKEKAGFIEHLMKIGVDAVDVAIPSARGTHLKVGIESAKMLHSEIAVVCLARTKKEDIEAALELAQGAGRQVEVIIFVGSSPIRRWVEGWEVDEMVKWMADSTALASRSGLIPNIATEHTTQTEPEVLKKIYRAGLENGGRKVCLADTTGAATPKSVSKLIQFFQTEILVGFDDIDIDWHGHNDRGLAVVNSLEALVAGARRVHGTALGIGERAGNTPIEQLLLNLKIAGDPKRQDLTHIPAFSAYSSRIFGVPITANYPGIGEKVSKTGSGIHAAAMYKAKQLGIEAGAPYSSVDPRWFGRESDVIVGPLAGKHNVLFVAERLGIKPTDKLINGTLAFAKQANRNLTDQDFIHIANSLENGHN